VELEWTAFLPRVVQPDERPRSPIESSEEAVAGTDENEIPRDRGGREDSPSGVEGPERSRILGGANVGRVFAPDWKVRARRDESLEEDAQQNDRIATVRSSTDQPHRSMQRVSLGTGRRGIQGEEKFLFQRAIPSIVPATID